MITKTVTIKQALYYYSYQDTLIEID